jgi:hypothetical protein
MKFDFWNLLRFSWPNLIARLEKKYYSISGNVEKLTIQSCSRKFPEIYESSGLTLRADNTGSSLFGIEVILRLLL